jgi:hypothetical protein
LFGLIPTPHRMTSVSIVAKPSCRRSPIAIRSSRPNGTCCGTVAVRLVDLVVVHPVSGPSQHFRPVCLHIDSCVELGHSLFSRAVLTSLNPPQPRGGRACVCLAPAMPKAVAAASAGSGESGAATITIRLCGLGSAAPLSRLFFRSQLAPVRG